MAINEQGKPTMIGKAATITPQSRATKRLGPDALAIKALISTTSLAVTLGGWAVLAAQQPITPATGVQLTDTVAMQPAASSIELSLAPLPTVAPAPPPPEIGILSPPAAPSLQHAAPQPAISPPTLRVVSAPPKPVARTRSSR